MTDADLREAVESFLADYDDAMSEYEQGYVDADAALSVIERHANDLRRAAEDAEDADGGVADDA